VGGREVIWSEGGGGGRSVWPGTQTKPTQETS
jgi:hypothetical protein